ncbi:MAG: iron-sulfur cluster assembly protein [Bacteroidales bacterium]|nr:DUF59 domain-containing protein [Bacteroidales bacterium]MBQ7213610.1 DUF59 domain-containing protein [Bacteroidales bacterium]MBR3287410.1 DUF59 domain-containing protein [Bacteroidales bacterium]MCR5714922.1 iron-sulfur cluster assembly protein [Bacteroidales bacterium]
MEELLSLEAKIVATLKGIYDPEIPINIYDLGLIYNIDCQEDNTVNITMTLTAPSCPMAEDLVENVRYAVSQIDGVRQVNINLVFEPVWNKDMISEEALLQLDLL